MREVWLRMDKVFQKIEEAIADVNYGATIAIAGFFACGVPRLFLQALISKVVKKLTVSCGCGSMLGVAVELKQLLIRTLSMPVVSR